MSESIARYRERFDADAPALPGSGTPWLDAARRASLAAFEARGFPGPREEDWKYTRVSAIEKRDFAAAPQADAVPDLAGLRLPGDEAAAELVFLDGRLRGDLSRRGSLPDGVLLEGLAEALTRGDGTLEPYLSGSEHPHAFLALNAAFAGEGVVLRVPADTALEAPVHLLFVSTGRADHIAHPRVVIECAAGSRATVVESFVAAGDSAYLNNAVTQATVGPGATLAHYKLQRESDSAYHVSTLAVQQQAGSRFESHSMSLGAALARHDINVAFGGEDASCVLNGLYVGRGRQHVDYHTRIDHAVPRCVSEEDYRGVLGGRSRGVFNGRVYVHPHAQQTDASQSNRNLLLSRDAEVDTKPQLEIYANDVKCAHGATVGQLDERMVFYLRSRGLEESAARALLTYGFARDLVDRMEIPALREVVSAALLESLPQGEELRSMLS